MWHLIKHFSGEFPSRGELSHRQFSTLNPGASWPVAILHSVSANVNLWGERYLRPNSVHLDIFLNRIQTVVDDLARRNFSSANTPLFHIQTNPMTHCMFRVFLKGHSAASPIPRRNSRPLATASTDFFFHWSGRIGSEKGEYHRYFMSLGLARVIPFPKLAHIASHIRLYVLAFYSII
jgi:hypothetical protein